MFCLFIIYDIQFSDRFRSVERSQRGMWVSGQDSNPDLPTYYTIWASSHPEKFNDGVNNTGGYIFSHIYIDRGDTGGKFGTGVNDANIIRGRWWFMKKP